MAILIVSVDFPPHTDGVSTVSHELACRLSGAGEDVIVIGPKSRDDRGYDCSQEFKVIRTPFYEKGYLRFIPIFFVMPYVIRRHKIKKVIAMNIAYGGIISYIFSKALGFSYILWAYGYEFGKFERNSLIKHLYLQVYKNSSFVCAITDFVKMKLEKFGVPAKKIVLIKPGTDPLKYHPLKVSDDFRGRYYLENKRVIMSTSRLIERKGIDMTLRALGDVLKVYPDTVYVIVGNGPFRDSLVALSIELGVADSVRFMGRVSDEELLNFYNLCDIFLMPSRTLTKRGDIEGFGIVFLEANACAKPVIGGRDGGMGEAIVDGVTGILVDPQSPKEISAAIIKLLSDKEYAQRLGEAGRKRVVEEFNWQGAVNKFHKYLLKGKI